LRKELAENSSKQAAVAYDRLSNFMNSINTKTLIKKSATDVINEGKKLLTEIVKSVYPEEPKTTSPLLKGESLNFMGNRYFTFSTVVRVNQIETSRDKNSGVDEAGIHSPESARKFRETIEKLAGCSNYMDIQLACIEGSAAQLFGYKKIGCCLS